jgi:serine/threonine protein kinase
VAADEDFRERLKRESQLLASVDHPNVITAYEAGEADGQLFMSMR